MKTATKLSRTLRQWMGLGLLATVLLASVAPAGAQSILMNATTGNGSFELPVAPADGTNAATLGGIPGWSHPGAGGDANFNIRRDAPFRDVRTDGDQALNVVTLGGWSSDVLTSAPLLAGQSITMSVDVGWDSWVNSNPAAGSTFYLYAVNPANFNDLAPILSFTGQPDYNGFGTDAGWVNASGSALVQGAWDGWYAQVVVASGGNANNLVDNFVIATAAPEPAALLSRGHQILLEKGLQIQAQVFPRLEDTAQEVGFDLTRWEESNFTTANFHFNDQTEQYVGPSPGIPWGRYAAGQLRPEEFPNLPSLVSIQYRDERPLNDPDELEAARAWLENYRALYPDALSYTNQWGSQLSTSVMQNYLAVAQPDMVMFDTYSFNGNASGANRSETTLYEHMQKYRLLGLGGHDTTGNQPIPYALYTQHFVDPSGHQVSDSEMWLSQFSAWAFGYTFVSALEYNQFSTQYPPGSAYGPVLFSTVGDSNPTARFYIQAEINRQSRNLGSTLVRLLSTDIRFVRGQYRNAIGGTSNNPVPGGISEWDAAADPYITGITATNIGTQNNGRRGDVLVGYFRPLLESFDGSQFEDEIYFMVVNGLVDPALDADVRQSIHLTFDFGASGITTLQRLNRDTGEVEVVSLVHDGGSLYHLDLILDGGVGDLFKFNTGAPFVIPEPASLGLLWIGCVGVALRRRQR